MQITKKSNLHRKALAFTLAASLFASTPGLFAQSGTVQQEQPQQNQQQGKTFAGKIVKLQNGQYALLIGQPPDGKAAGHFLDDQDNAKKYENKQVTVAGSFDTASNMIHATNIQAA
jgi:hypothetical protein